MKFMMDFEKPVVELETKLEELKKLKTAGDPEVAQQIEFLEGQLEKLRQKIYSKLTSWQRVQVARHPDRPRTLDYIETIFSDFIELHGDRLFKDDPSIVGGFAYFNGNRTVVIGHQKGKNTKENIHRNFGMAHPEGYRKALRLMKLAEKFNLPLICFIDTPGAYPGIGAEERGQAKAIADNLMAMSMLEVPIVAVNIGEGGSGGALALSVANRLLMLENAYYSVITPEGCASILWRDDSKAPEAAEALCLTADKLLDFGIIDEVISEPLGGAHRHPEFVVNELKEALKSSLENLFNLSSENLLENRYQKYRKIGSFLNNA